MWEALANKCFSETRNNYHERTYQFYQHLVTLQKNNLSSSESRLLENIPLVEISHSKSIYAKEIKDNDTANPDTKEDGDRISPILKKFLLKFLRGGNHDPKRATKLLLAYLLMMKDHPKYYVGLTNQGINALYQLVSRSNFAFFQNKRHFAN